MLDRGCEDGNVENLPTSSPTVLGPTPQVDGRLLGFIIAEFGAGPGETIFCESDAVVHLEGRVVTEIVHHGDRPKIEPGDEVVESLDRPNRAGVEPRETGASGSQIHYDVQVYWDDMGELRVGCAPESLHFEDKNDPPPTPPETLPFP